MLKTNTKYKLLVIVPLFGIAINGCTPQKSNHNNKETQNNIDNKNVIVDIKDNYMCVRDVKYNEARTVYFSTFAPKFPQGIIDKNIQNLEYSKVGDTVEINATHYDTQYAFRFPPMDISEIIEVKFNRDTILARQAQQKTR